MPSSSKKKGTGKGKAKGKGSAASAASANSSKKPPRTNDEIIGGRIIDVNRPPKKALVRELCDALLYEVNSESRATTIDQVAALEDIDAIKDGGEDTIEQVKAKIPVTYETAEMLEFPGKCMLTVGRTATFHVEKVYHDKPLGLIQHFQDDEEQLKAALLWTGEDPVINILFPQQRLCGKDSIVFLGECFLDKESVAHFAGRFAKGSGGSRFNWPNSWSVLQCPFTCTMAVPEPEKTGKPKRYIMILQNIRQVAVINGGFHMPHRGLPRLCDKEYFEKNLIGGLEHVETDRAQELPPSVEWCQYPHILEEGIVFGAAKKILPSRTAEMATSSAHFLPSAYTLFNYYHESGMCAAVSQVIDDKQSSMMRKSSAFPNFR